MSLRTCADCSTQYAVDLVACPHCGSGNFEKEDTVTERLPLFVTVTCPDCQRGPWTVRLTSRSSGLVELPTLACASCGSQVPVTWPPKEEPMSPKITAVGGATNARSTNLSPVVEAGPEPQVAAEGDLGLTPEKSDSVQNETVPEVDGVRDETKDYEAMTLAELREAATARDLPSYGTKAQLTERLREADVA